MIRSHILSPSAHAAFALLGFSLATIPASAGVVFSESFEAPVVSGFDDNTVPSGGKWIGATDGFGASNRGHYNETVAWPATPAFTTPYGNQAYYLNYTNSGLTTAAGVIGSLTADVTYRVTFNTAVTANTASGNYRLELVAFAPGEIRTDVNGTMPGTVLAAATGSVTTNDMSATGSVTFTPAAANAHLGKDLAIRLVKSTNSVLYDNIRLITGHDLNPDPANGEDLAIGGNVTLGWTNMPPIPPATDTHVDLWFGPSPGTISQVVDGAIANSFIVSAPTAGTYQWRVDSYPDGNPNGTPVTGQVFSFTIADTDGDGFPDTYELANTNPPSNTALNPGDDLENGGAGDGLSNLQEYQYGTNPNDPDSDDDNLLDGAEINGTAGLRPPTSPVDSDSDDDGLSDGVESNTGTWVSSADTGTNPKDNDWDKDGLLDGAETNNGTLVDKENTGTNPYLSDTDDDDAGDYYEVEASLTSPFDPADKPFVPYPLPDPDGSTGATDQPVKVFICSGQSNMVGMGTVNGTGEETLETMTRRQNKFPNLIDGSGAWTARQDVRYRGVISATANGPLTAGQGADSGKVGPELGFGHILGWYLDESVLVLKSSIGNRSLGWDILPAGRPSYQYGGNNYAAYGDATLKWPIGGSPATWAPGGWYAGYEWDRYFLHEDEWIHPHDAVTNVVDILDNWNGEYGGSGKPFEGRDFEIAGFVWWQGDKDRYDMGHATRYEQNLVNLIQSLRSYYSTRYPGKVANNAPFVLATLGQTAIGDTSSAADKAILDAQLAVDGEAGNYPQFENNVKTVYAHPLSQGGASNSHYNGNAETYMLVGDALGRAMIDLLQASTGPDENPPVTINLNPANGASGVSAGMNLVATFNELIAKGTGNIMLRNLPDDGPVGDVVIPVTDASQVSIAGNILTVNPTANLATSTQYAVLIDATAIKDLAGNSYAGIADHTIWSFTTASPDTIAPTLSSTNPANGATVVADADLKATFSEPIALGSGNITLKNLTDGPTGDMLIAVTDGARVSVSGAVLTINPAANLPLGKNFAVRIAATAIDDLVGNSFTGIGDDATWFFSTPVPPPVGVVFFDNFEAGGNPSALPATAGSYSNTPDVSSAQSTGDTSGASNTALWVRATQGFGASRCGLVDESAGAFTDPVGQQAFAFRYTNSGLTTAFGVIGNLTAGTTYTVSFDVVADTVATPYNMQFVTFNGGGTRNDVRSDSFVSKVLASRSGNAPGDGSYQTVSFQFTPDPVLHAAVIGQDLALRFKGATTSASIDNINVSSSGGSGGGNPFDDWAGGFAGLSDSDPTLDFDDGGLETGLEWVLGGDPTDGGDDATIAPTINNTTDPDFFIFTYRRADDANADAKTAIAVEYGNDLDGWSQAVAGPDIVITPTNNAAGARIDLVEVKIRRTLAQGGRLFARLNIEVAE
jgi:hypothetical protein